MAESQEELDRGATQRETDLILCEEPGCDKAAKVCVVVNGKEEENYWCFEHMKVKL